MDALSRYDRNVLESPQLNYEAWRTGTDYQKEAYAIASELQRMIAARPAAKNDNRLATDAKLRSVRRCIYSLPYTLNHGKERT